jgi:hypothetical protein
MAVKACMSFGNLLMPLPNDASSVFKAVNMLTGPIYNGPNESIRGTRCWPFTNKLNSSGRPYFRVQGKNYLAYRLVYELVNGELDAELMILHQCDNPKCCNPAHLKAGTRQQNSDEMKERERHGLPHHTVRAIRKLASSGLQTHKDIAELYGIGRSTVTEIVGGVNYGHVSED